MALRPWQSNAKERINKIASENEHSLIAVNACVGSGKTTVAMEAMVDFIKRNPTECTLQVFRWLLKNLTKLQKSRKMCSAIKPFNALKVKLS